MLPAAVGICRRGYVPSCVMVRPHHHTLPFAGKTTLLDLVAGRKTSGRLAPGSEILFNGRPPSSALLRRDGGCPAASSGSCSL